MRRLDWFLAAVIVVFLLACMAAQGLSRAMVDVAAGAPSTTRESFMQRLVSPTGDPISVQCPELLRRRLMDDPGDGRRC
jgi:hypothetical protein